MKRKLVMIVFISNSKITQAKGLNSAPRWIDLDKSPQRISAIYPIKDRLPDYRIRFINAYVKHQAAIQPLFKSLHL